MYSESVVLEGDQGDGSSGRQKHDIMEPVRSPATRFSGPLHSQVTRHANVLAYKLIMSVWVDVQVSMDGEIGSATADHLCIVHLRIWISSYGPLQCLEFKWFKMVNLLVKISHNRMRYK
jgi:hypothetical protein